MGDQTQSLRLLSIIAYLYQFHSMHIICYMSQMYETSRTGTRRWAGEYYRSTFIINRVRRSLDHESTATLVHAFVTSRIDYGNAPCSRTRQELRLTSCSASWTPPPESLLLHGSRSGFDAHPPRWTALGWMFHNALPSNCAPRCITAFTAWHRSTSLSFVCQLQT